VSRCFFKSKRLLSLAEDFGSIHIHYASGEWLLSSYIATGIENVPIFIKADNAENEIEKYLRETA